MTQKLTVVYCQSATESFLAEYEWQEGQSLADFLQQLALTEFSTQAGLTQAIEQYAVGVFSHLIKKPASYVLQAGDRIELYRPLTITPMEVRRQRAQKFPVGRVKYLQPTGKKKSST